MMTISLRMRRQRNRPTSRGMTLVELLVALAINSAIVAAAALLYLSTTRNNTQLEEQAKQREVGVLILDMLGRDLNNAGFYPFSYNPYASQTLTSATLVTTALERMSSGDFPNPAENNATLATNASVATAVFGCDGSQFFNSTARTCQTSVANAPDSLVVNYYAADGFLGGSNDWATNGPQPVDCLGQRVATGTTADTPTPGREPLNSNRRPPSVASAPPTTPYFVQNVYSLTALQNVTVNGQTYSTRSFQCAGNGNVGSYQPLFQGVHDFHVTYGLMAAPPTPPTSGGTVPAPSRVLASGFLSAADVTSQNAWGRVVALKACVVTRTPLNSPKASRTSSYVGCDGSTVSVAATDQSIYASFERTYQLRNRTFIAFAY